MIYTSYFARIKDLPLNVIPVSIAAKAPDWFTGIQYKVLAPSYELLMKYKEDHDEAYYRKCYKEQVTDLLDPNIVAKDMVSLGQDVALLCYEKPEDFCHRHLVGKWLDDHGISCEEYNFRRKHDLHR